MVMGVNPKPTNAVFIGISYPATVTSLPSPAELIQGNKGLISYSAGSAMCDVLLHISVHFLTIQLHKQVCFYSQ